VRKQAARRSSRAAKPLSLVNAWPIAVNAMLERACRLLRQKSPVNGKYCASDKGPRIEHRRATPVGGSVEITATPSRGVAGSRLTFDVQAIDGSGQLVAAGQIDRAIVDRQRFLASVSADAGHQ